MDDSRIKQLTEEVLSQIRGGPDASSRSNLEDRVAALEAAVTELRASLHTAAPPAPVSAAIQVQVSPSLQLLNVAGGGSERCLLEPDKPCVQSGQCRSLGH